MFKDFTAIFGFSIILCFQGVYAEQGTEKDFTKYFTCFKALENKTDYNPDRYPSGYFEEANIVVLPHPSSSHTWLFVTESSIYQQQFWSIIGNTFFTRGTDGLRKSTMTHFELSLSNEQRLHLTFNYKQYLQDGPLRPSLGTSLVKNGSETCDPSFCTILTPNDTTDTDKKFIFDSLRDRIQTVHRYFSESNYQNHPMDDFISALNTCTGVDKSLDSVITQEIEKF